MALSISIETKKKRKKSSPLSKKSRERQESNIAKAYSRATEVLWTQALSGTPTALVTGFFVIIFGATQYIMDEFVFESNASAFVFFVGSYVVGSSYFVIHFYMQRYSTSYAAIADDKQFYVLSNLIKSGLLLAYTPAAGKTLYDALINDSWDNVKIRNLGVLYAIPDAVSLILVVRMQNRQ